MSEKPPLSESLRISGITFTLNKEDIKDFLELEKSKVVLWEKFEKERVELYKKDVNSKLETDKIRIKEIEDYKNYIMELLNNIKEQNKLMSEILNVLKK